MMMCSFHGSTDASFFVAILMRMQLQEIFNEADTNKDGKVNTDELAALIANSEVRYSFAHCPPTQQYLLHFYCRDSGFMI
jgi:hypothetical protein